NAAGNTGLLLSSSDDAGSTWSTPAAIGQQAPGHDRFNHWLSVDAATGDVTVSYYDATGFTTDVLLSRSTDGSVHWRRPDVRVTTQSSNEHDCDGVFPCLGINYGNQQGDYEGLVSFGGVSHPIWTDSRLNLVQFLGCRRNLTMEEVFTAAVKN
ncbi:MAG TPA: sialidase family protein, partial [Acidimicrobiales bacterium]